MTSTYLRRSREQEALKRAHMHAQFAHQCITSALKLLPQSASRVARTTIVDAEQTLALTVEALAEEAPPS